MAKPPNDTKKADPPLELRYTLAELPSSQHRAGLAGLALMVDWVRRQPGKQPGICEVLDLDARGLTLRIDEQGLIRLFNEVYGASHQEQRSASEWKGQVPLDIREETTEVKGKPKTKKFFIYQVVVPRGAMLREWDPGCDDAGNGPWVKLWRDMIWQIMRGIPAQRLPFNNRADGSYDQDARKAWSALKQPDKSVALASTYFLGAQDQTAEAVSFQDRSRFQFVLHFWPFVTQIYVPQAVDNEGNTNAQGYALAIPDVGDLEEFVDVLPDVLQRRSPEIRGFRPADCLIDLAGEAALDLFGRLQQVVAAREGARGKTRGLLTGVDIFHMFKDGNNIRVLGCGRVAPDRRMVEEYQRFRGQYWSPIFRHQYVTNMLDRRPWFHGFDRIFSTTSWKHTIDSHTFRHDTRHAFKEADMTDIDTDTEISSPPSLGTVLYKMVGMYVTRKVKTKYGIEYESAKAKGQLDEFNKAREKVGRDAFLAARSRTGGDFVDFFTSTICSMPQHIRSAEYDVIAKALLDPASIEQVRTLTLLALSARS